MKCVVFKSFSIQAPFVTRRTQARYTHSTNSIWVDMFFDNFKNCIVPFCMFVFEYRYFVHCICIIPASSSLQWTSEQEANLHSTLVFSSHPEEYKLVQNEQSILASRTLACPRGPWTSFCLARNPGWGYRLFSTATDSSSGLRWRSRLWQCTVSLRLRSPHSRRF